MSHEIDLEKYNIRTDLAIEAIANTKSETGIKSHVEETKNLTITTVYLDSLGSTKIGKPEGSYITIEFDDVTDYDNKEKVKEVFSEKLKEMLSFLKIKEDDLVLIVGLGNEKSTPDSLGPLVINNIVVTNHLYLLNSLGSGFKRVCALKPGVMGTTGFETSDLIKSVTESLKPELLIVVDSLASQSVERLNKTIQMTDSGINPGSGIGNNRKAINKQEIGIPVIAIGVPTVVDAVTIVSDTFNYMHKHFSYSKQNINNPFNKLIPVTSINYLKHQYSIKKQDKEQLLGMVGSLDDNELKQLIFEVLTPIGYNLMVTPKEVDFLMNQLGDIIGNGINRALHKNINNI
ncbi:MAG: GPR endopeptidase [Bacilli bacterium]|nr:GPR endopeptidase [Bacilli bacterium]MDD4547491.1 GPR endopeptidase [Bacilli bacterium]